MTTPIRQLKVQSSYTKDNQTYWEGSKDSLEGKGMKEVKVQKVVRVAKEAQEAKVNIPIWIYF